MKFKVLIALSILFLTLGAVSAADNATDDIAEISEGDVLDDTVSGNTFGDIQKAVNDAQANTVINLNGTYNGYGTPIKVNKNLEFNGGTSGATMDARKLSGVFTTSKKCTITLKNLNFINAKGSVFLDTDHYNSESKLIIDNCNFTDNVGDEYGAVVCYDCIVTNSNFINNRAAGIDDGTEYVSGGGAIEARRATLTNCNFERNTALDGGGAIDASNVEANYCNFKQNSAKKYGGAICGDVTIHNSNFTSNSAGKWDGGAIMGSGNIHDSIFTSNSAGFTGGAIYGDVKVENSKFISNKAQYGGAIHSSYEGVTIVNSTFESNDDAAVIAHRVTVKTPDRTFKGKTILGNDLKSFQLIKVDVKKLSTTYNSGKTIQIKLTKTTSKKPAASIGVYVNVYKGKKLFDAWAYTDEALSSNSNGIATFKASKLPVGKYTLEISEGYVDNDDDYFTCTIPETTITLKVSKAKTIVKAPKVTAKYKKTKYFKVTVKNKATKKPVKSLKLKVKVYTGKKYKSYTIKTDKNGVGKLNTKKLGWGKHKVVVTSKNTNYKLSKKSSITIK